VRNFNSNKLTGLCIPGRTPENDTFVGQNSTPPPSEYFGDKILGMGMSYKNSTPSAAKTYLASCGIMDSTNNYFYTTGDPSTSNAANIALVNNSGSQAVSTNALSIFKTIFATKGMVFPILSGNTGNLTTQTFTENRCMRAPGASCFSDLDCAPSKAISDKIKMLNSEDTAVTFTLNKYEVKFWQEELVCAQDKGKNETTYSAFNNRCCREVGKTISLPSTDLSNPLLMGSIPGVDIKISEKFRYTRVATVYKDQKNDPSNFPVLNTAISNQCTNTTSSAGCLDTSALTNQFITFSAYAERTSCSGDWVRNFSNGNHTWDKNRLTQPFNLLMFQCMNWSPSFNNYSCAGLAQNDPGCSLVQTSPTSSKAKGVMNFLGKLELLGIPQIAIESEDYYNTTTPGDLSCLSNPSFPADLHYPGGSAADASSMYLPPIQIYAASIPNKREYYDSTAVKQLYSAADLTNFQSPLKLIFKSDEVASCLAAGTIMAVGADPNLCCTGFINSQNNLCQLPDYVDVSLYTNRYVSSEAKKLNISLFDQNGYIKDPSYAVQLACSKNICSSGVLAYGILVSYLLTPGQENINQKYFRFMEGADASENTNGLLNQYKSGLKLNNHAYCFPKNSTSTTDLRITNCVN
jgi:hypothetical protein